MSSRRVSVEISYEFHRVRNGSIVTLEVPDDQEVGLLETSESLVEARPPSGRTQARGNPRAPAYSGPARGRGVDGLLVGAGRRRAKQFYGIVEQPFGRTELDWRAKTALRTPSCNRQVLYHFVGSGDGRET